MYTFWQSVITGISTAPVLALSGVAFVIIFRATRVFNFALGYLIMLGMYLGFLFVVQLGQSPLIALPLVIITSAVIAGACYQLVMTKMAGQADFAQVIVTLGLAILITGFCGVTWGSQALNYQMPGTELIIKLPDGLTTSVFDVVAFAATILIFLGLMAFFRYTATGLKMQAVAENPVLAARRGISVNGISTLSWVIAGLLVGCASIVLTSHVGISPSVAEVGISVFPALILGGLDSILGAFVGSLVISVISSLSLVFLGGSVRDVVVFGIMLVILMVRPNGFFGTKEARRV
jgi:branched-chain amino acid transport system permease protein